MAFLDGVFRKIVRRYTYTKRRAKEETFIFASFLDIIANCAHNEQVKNLVSILIKILRCFVSKLGIDIRQVGWV